MHGDREMRTEFWEASNKQKTYEFMQMQVFAILDKAQPDTENIRRVNLAAVKRE
jgi:hypothetical protein